MQESGYLSAAVPSAAGCCFGVRREIGTVETLSGSEHLNCLELTCRFAESTKAAFAVRAPSPRAFVSNSRSWPGGITSQSTRRGRYQHKIGKRQ